MLRLAFSADKSMAKQTSASVDETELLSRIVEGDGAAFEAFYNAYYPRLYRFILRVTHKPDTVEELIQDTLMVVWEKPESFDHSCKLSTWVFGIAYRKALKSLAKNSRYSSMVDLEGMEEILADSRPTPAVDLEVANWLETALATLPADQRAVLELTFHHGLHYRDVALILDCPENTVKTRMFHARKKLQAFASDLK
jgi:RNA polymerase sigma-70 factor (ECF subfamily)